jgi:hypothetical protein
MEILRYSVVVLERENIRVMQFYMVEWFLTAFSYYIYISILIL